MIEPEIAFADLKDDMMLAESMLKYVINYVLENAPEEMEFFNQFVDKGLIERLHHVATSEFGHITYTDAITELEKHNDEFEYKVSWGCDLQTEHERYLTEKVFGRPVFVTDYPKEIKAFYMKLNEDGKTVAAMDCLVPGIGEIIVLFIQTTFCHSLLQNLKLVLSLAAADDFSDTWHEAVHCCYGLSVWVKLHVESLDFLWIIGYKYRTFEYFFCEVTFMFCL